MNAVKIIANEDGQIVNVNSNSPEYGYVRIGQTISKFNPDGWISTEERYFLLKGKLEALQNSGLDSNSVLPGKLIRQESLEPFDDYSQPKVAGSSGVVCKVNGQPIYSRVVWDQTGTAHDVLIAHDNKEEIIASLANNNVKPIVNPGDISDAFETEEEVSNEIEEEVESKADNSLNEEVEVEETIDETVDELDLETDFEL